MSSTYNPHHLVSRPRVGRAALVGLFVLGLLASLALTLAPAKSLAAGSPVRFGSALNSTVQPSNSSPGIDCRQSAYGACTMVQEEAYGRPNGGEIAPKTGTITKIRVIAGEFMKFRPQIVNVKHSTSTTLSATKAKASFTGPLLTATGQTEANDEEGVYNVESFKVHIPVKKGQQLAMLTGRNTAIRCSSGGHNTLLFGLPPAKAGGPAVPATDANGCWTLMEAVIK
jgi:hypothetical protein